MSTNPNRVEHHFDQEGVQAPTRFSESLLLDGGPIRTRIQTTEYASPSSTRNLLGEQQARHRTIESIGSCFSDSSNKDQNSTTGGNHHKMMRQPAPQRLVAVRYFLDRPGYVIAQQCGTVVV